MMRTFALKMLPMVTAGIFGMSYLSAQNLDSGLVAYYPFNGNANDESGSAANGVVFGATLSTDRFGGHNGSYQFDGVDDYIKASASSLPSAQRSVSFWFSASKVSNKPYMVCYGGQSPPEDQSWLMGLNFWGLGAYTITIHSQPVGSGQTLLSTYESPPISEWHHFVGTTSPTGTKIFVDGQLASSDTFYVANTYVSGKDLIMGSGVYVDGFGPWQDANAGYYEGQLDEVRIYDRELTGSEIETLFEEGGWPQASPPLSPSNLIAAAGSGEVHLYWNPNVEADFLRYRIYGGTDPQSLAFVDSAVGGRHDTTKTVTGLLNGILYYFQITAIDSLKNESGFSNQASATPQQPFPWTGRFVGDGPIYNDVTYINRAVAVAVGNGGDALRSSDGGVSWSHDYITTTSWVEVAFIKSGIGLTVGESGGVARSTDGGISWSIGYVGNSNKLNDIHFVDSNLVVSVGNSGTIVKSTDGGVTWTDHSLLSTQSLYGISSASSGSCFAVGSGGYIFRSIDGGTNWVQQPRVTSNDILSIGFANPANGIATTSGGGYLKTSDGGESWQFLLIPGISVALNDISYDDSLVATIVGDSGVVVRTTDGGANWIRQESGTTVSLKGVSFIDPNVGLAIGSATLIHTTNGGVPTQDTTPPSAPQGLDAVARNEMVSVRWSMSSESDFLRYRIYGGTAPNPTIQIDSTLGGIEDTKRIVTGLINGTAYFFRVTAVDSTGNESGFSNEATAIPSPRAYYVSTTGSDSSEGLSPAPFRTIQYALNTCVEGDSVIVFPGLYEQRVVVNTGSILFGSTYCLTGDTSTISQTTIDAKRLGATITINKSTASIEIVGLTIRGGAPKDLDPGSGIYVVAAKELSVENCVIVDNYGLYGGGVYLSSVEATVFRRSKIIDNQASQNGGGIWSNNTVKSLLLENSLVAENSVDGLDGGGLYIEGTDSARIVHSTIARNSIPLGRYGPGIAMNTDFDSVLVFNSIVSQNRRIGEGSEVQQIWRFSGKLALIGTYTSGNEAEQNVSYRASGNVFSVNDPFKVNYPFDYSLVDSAAPIGAGTQSVSFYGLAVDSPSEDLFGNARPQPMGSNPDMGAIESPLAHPLYPNPPPEDPQNLTATPGNAQVLLSWTRNTESDFLRYRIYGGTSPNPTTQIDSTTGGIDDTSKIITGLTNGTTYYFRVTAVDSAGNESGYSNQSSVTLVPPPTPIALTPVDGSVGLPAEVTLAWYQSPGANSYRVQVASSANFLSGMVLDDSSVFDTLRVISGLLEGATYYWRLNATNALGTSSYSAIWQFSTLDTTSPITPRSLTATPGDGEVLLRWLPNPEPDILSYVIYADIDHNPTTEAYTTTPQDTSYPILGLVNGTTYYFRIKARDNSLNESGYSNEVIATPQAIVSGLSLISPPNGAANVGINPLFIWNSHPGAGSYDLIIGYDSSLSLRFSLLNPSDTSYQGTVLPDTTYFWKVVALPDSLASPTWKFSSSPPPPLPPTGLVAVAGNAKVDLTWNRVDGANLLRYRIYGGTSPNPSTQIDSTTGGISDTSKTITGLTNGTTYYFRVTAVDSAENESGYSNEVLVTPNAASFDGEYSADGNTVLLLPMNEMSGTSVQDASVHGNDGLALGGASPSAGRFGYGRSIIGPTQSMSIPHHSSLNFDSGKYTIELWVKIKVTGASFGRFIEKAEDTTPYRGWLLGLLAPPDFFAHAQVYHTESGSTPDYTALSGTTDLYDGRWHHIATTVTSSKISIFIDGVFENSTLYSPTVSSDNAGEVEFNNSSKQGAPDWSIVLDEVRVSNAERSPQEFNLQLPPRDLTAIASGSTIDLSWQNGGGAIPLMRYYIYRGPDSTSVVLIDSTTNSVYADTGLQSDFTYYYRISAVDSTGFEGRSSMAGFAKTSQTNFPPAKPNNLLAQTGDSQVTLTWNKNQESDFLRYRIYGGTSPNPTTKIDSTTGGISDTSKTIDGLTNGTTYYFRVTAVDSAGNESEYSNEVSVTPQSVDLESDLVAYYPFNGNAHDESGHGNNGVTYWVVPAVDRLGNAESAYLFDGTSSHIRVPYSVSIGVQEALTLSAWIYMDGGGPYAPRVLEIRNRNTQGGYYLAASGNSNVERTMEGTFRTTGTTGHFLSTTAPVAALSWHHVVFAVDGASRRSWIYIDGALRDSSSCSEVITSMDYGVMNDLFIGSDPDSVHRWGGCIDDIRIYSRALSAVEVSSLYHAVGWPDHSPPTPQNVSAAPGNTQITVTWNRTTDPAFLRYRIYGGTSPNPTTQIDSTTGGISDTSKTITGLANGTTYYFRVTAVDSAGNESGYSNEVSATPYDNDAPMIPQNLSAIPGNGQAILRWSRNSEPDFLRYIIYAGIAPEPTTRIDSANGGVSDTSITILGLENDVLHFFRITAVDISGNESDYSTDVWAVPFVLLPGEYSTDTATVLLLHLNYVSGLDVRDVSGKGHIVGANGVSVTDGRFGRAWRHSINGDFISAGPSKYLDSSDSREFTVDFWLRCNSLPAAGANIISNDAWIIHLDMAGAVYFTVNGTSGPSYLSTPYFTITVGEWMHVAAIWSGHTRYQGLVIDGRVFSKADPAPESLVGNSSDTRTSRDGNLVGDLDEIRISTIAKDTASFRGPWAPMAPANLTATAGNAKVLLAWHKSSEPDFLRYRIYGDTSANPTTKIDSTTGGISDTSKTIAGLTNGTTYYFRATAVDSAGYESGYSNEVAATPTSVPAPQNLRAWTGPEDSSVVLKWDSGPGTYAHIIRVYGSTSPNPTTLFDTASAAYDSLILKGLGSATYYFRITAVDSVEAKESSYSNEVSINPIQDRPSTIQAPTSLVATPVSTTRIDLGWSDNSIDEEGFRIEMRVGAGGPYGQIASVGVNQESYQSTGLSPATEYYFRVRAFNSMGNSVYSNEASATTLAPDIQAPSSPQGLTATPSGWSNTSQYTLSWTNPTDQSGIAAAHYSVNQVPSESQPGTRVTIGTSSISIPWSTEGEFTAWVYLEDGGGNKDPLTAVSVMLRHDHTRPGIVHDSASVASWSTSGGTDISVVASLTDALSGPRILRLQYRASGSPWSMTANFPDSATADAVAAIPTSFIGSNAGVGVDYRIIGEDRAGNSAYTPAYSIRIRLAQNQSRSVPQPGASSLPENQMVKAYRMLSVPLDLDNKTPQHVLVEQTGLGAYDTTEWRFFAYNPSRPASFPFDDYPEIATSQIITPGRAFYLIMSSAKTVSTGPGSVLRTDEYATVGIPVQSGWNLIGNPFSFDVPLDSLSLSNGLSLTGRTWYYDGSGPNSGWTPNPTVLKAWEGIAINMGTQGPASLRFDLADRSSQAAPNPGFRINGSMNPAAKSWSIGIDATRADNNISDISNVAAVDPTASDGWDQHDMFEPPMLGGGSVSLSFPNAEGPLTHDYRRAGDEGYVWDFKVTTPEQHIALDLEFWGLDSIPSEAYLFDLDWRILREIHANKPLRISSRYGERRFRLVVGSKGFAESNSLGISLIPENIVFFDNYPNPFNPTTSLDFILPVDGHVKIEVYNILGERVASVHEGVHVAGRLVQVQFDARDLTSGIYFAVLEHQTVRIVKKMLLVK